MERPAFLAAAACGESGALAAGKAGKEDRALPPGARRPPSAGAGAGGWAPAQAVDGVAAAMFYSA
jgi:hypothetical protein